MENPTALSVQEYLSKKNIPTPDLHLVLGSGLVDSLVQTDPTGWQVVGELSFNDLEGINSSTAPSHRGTYRFYKNSKHIVSVQTGRLHGYEGNSPKEIVQPVITMFDLGVKKFILTNASGSCQSKFPAGSVMLISDQVNMTGGNPLTGVNDDSIGPRFPDMSQTYSPKINNILKKKLKAQKVKVGEGIYLGLNGPCFETPAETKLYAKWGMGAVGMSTVLEAIALKHRGAMIGGLSFVANMAAGIGAQKGKELSGDDVIKEGRKKAPLILKAIFEAIPEILYK